MSFDKLTPQELEIAQRQISQYGERAKEIVNELIACAVNDDHYSGGLLVREMYQEPDKLMLVIGLLTTAVVKSVNGPLATPEQLGVDADAQPETWQVGVGDQLQAAAEERDVEQFARIAVDAQIKASVNDFKNYHEATGQYPDAGHIMRALLMLDRVTVMALAAESLRRLVMREVEDG